MNKRRRYQAKRRRRWFAGVRSGMLRALPEYQTCPRCGDYFMACTCWEEDLLKGASLRPASGTGSGRG